MRNWVPLLLILLLYLLVGSFFAVYTPAWEAPDEPAHYNYVRQLSTGQLPRIEAGDYDQEFLNQVVFESHFAPQYVLDSIEYEDWQPPLYYLAQTPLFLLSDGSLLALRLFSLLLGAGVVAVTYAIALHLFPKRQWLAVTATVFVAFLPQHLAILASVNNDSLAELLIGIILLLMIRSETTDEDYSKGKDRLRRVDAIKQRLTLGVLLGLGFLTKATVYPMAILMALAIAYLYWGKWSMLWRAGALIFLPALLLGSLWWARNLTIYDGFDPLGTVAHDSVVTGQPRTAELVESVGINEAVRQFLETSFNSFWGQFGWMTVPLPKRAYQPLWLFSSAVIVGLVARPVRRRTNTNPQSKLPMLLLTGLFLLTAGVYIGYNFTYQQHQGRYLFPALVPIGIGVAMGLESWMNLVRRARPYWSYLWPIGLAVALISLDLWALFRVILPALS